ncbi:MAG: TPM domain-containing protein [Eubacteriales bacterium]
MKSENTKLSLAARFLLIFLSAVMLSIPVFAASYPKPQNNVADEAGVLSESTIRAIQTANKTLEIDTGCTIAVCTVDTTGDTDIAEYARGVFKEWKLGEGVLLLIAKNDENYYFVQSVGVEKVLSNETLETIRDEYLEEDFASGNIDRGVNKCVTKLKNELTAGINAASAEENTDENKSEEKGTTAGSVIVGFFKAILYIILIAIVLFVAFFIYAMFNDDAAAILQKYIFRRGQPQKMPEEYYDERLYGRPSNANGSQRRNPNQRNLPQGQRRQLPPSNQPRLKAPQNQTQYQNHNSNGMSANQRRQNTGNYNYQNNQQRNTNRSQNRNQEQYRQNQYNQNSRQSYNQPRNGQYNSQNYDAGSETRAYTIPGRNNQQ